ncbi:MAG: hypothetical protein HYY18_12215 [Planctomycetes bacterium]|nr:hypothetical protein [Planctomycetota bacterium]
MAFRLSFAFCFLAALAVVSGGVQMRMRLHEHMRTGDWISRANAAVLSAEDREAVPLLVELLDDSNPRVRLNALWALNRLTGMPWAWRTAECLKWWQMNGMKWETHPFDPAELGEFEADFGRGDRTIVFSGDDQIGVIVRPAEGAPRVDVILHSRWPYPLIFTSVGPRERYAAFLYRRDGGIARVVDEDEPVSCALEARITDAAGRRIARYWWTALDEEISPENPLIFDFETATLEPGEYVVEILLGPAELVITRPPRHRDVPERGFLNDARVVATFRR